MDNQTELMFRTRIEILITEREGMIAENHTRMSGGMTPAFGEGDFLIVQAELKVIEEQLRNY